MKRIIGLMAIVLTIAGCGRGIARLDKLDRVQAAVFTDARALAPESPAGVSPPLRITEPDRLIAIQDFLEARESQWQSLDGAPRPTRFQLELMGGSGPLYTLWIEPGYLAMASGNSLQETRLTNAQTAELLACLGLPPGYLNAAGPPEPASVPHYGVADGPRPHQTTRPMNRAGAKTVKYEMSAEEVEAAKSKTDVDGRE